MMLIIERMSSSVMTVVGLVVKIMCKRLLEAGKPAAM